MATTKLMAHRPRSQLLFLRHRTTSTAAVTATSSPHPPPPPPSQPPVLDLTNPEKLFSSLPTSRLLRATLNLHVASIEPMVDLGTWVINATLAGDAGKSPLRGAVRGFVRHTVFEHFCGGEDAAEAIQSVGRLNKAGLRGMVDFAAEFASDNESCDYNVGRFLDAVNSSTSLPPSSVSSVVVKITAICPLNLLQRTSDLLRWQQRDPSFDLSWKDATLPIFADSSPLYHTLERPEPLTPQEEQDLRLAEQRLWTLCEKCVEANVPLVVDAEHTQVQPAIDYLTNSAAIRYNKGDSPIVYNTIQTYLKDAKERLLLATKAAEKMGVQMGYKVVRGAYMSSERKLASEFGYESPIHNTIHETHACYNECASFLLQKIGVGKGAAILATHNVESGRLAAIKAAELGIGKGTHNLEFAQLYGMADALSLGLRNAGFRVSKYMPFGPVEKVIPYLLRRAEENRGLLSSSSLDRELMRKELKRRAVASIFPRNH